MARFRVKATVTADIWRDVEAATEEEARSSFYDGTFHEIVDEADGVYVNDINTESIKKVGASYRVRAYDVEYDAPDEESRKAAEKQPSEFEFWVEDVSPDDLEDSIQDEIEYKTGFDVKSFRHEVLEEK